MNPRLRRGGLSPLLFLHLAAGGLCFNDGGGDPAGGGDGGAGGGGTSETFTQEQVDNIVRNRVKGLTTKLEAKDGEIAQLREQAGKATQLQTALDTVSSRHTQDIELARAGLSNEEMQAARELHGKFGGDLSLVDFAKSKRSAIADLAGVELKPDGDGDGDGKPAGDSKPEGGDPAGGDPKEGEVDNDGKPGPGADPDGNRQDTPKPKLIDTDPEAWKKEMDALPPDQLRAKLIEQGILGKQPQSLEARLKGGG